MKSHFKNLTFLAVILTLVVVAGCVVPTATVTPTLVASTETPTMTRPTSTVTPSLTFTIIPSATNTSTEEPTETRVIREITDCVNWVPRECSSYNLTVPNAATCAERAYYCQDVAPFDSLIWYQVCPVPSTIGSTPGSCPFVNPKP